MTDGRHDAGGDGGAGSGGTGGDTGADFGGTSADTDDPDRLRPLRTDLTPIAEAVAAADADAFVAVGDRFDDDLRYLTRFAGPDRAYALVVVPGGDDATARAVCCVPSPVRAQAEREFVAGARDRGGADGDGDCEFHDGVAREVWTERAGDHAGERAAAVVRDLLGGGDEGGGGGDRDAPDDGDRDAPDDGDSTVLVPASIPHDAAVYLERAGNALASTDAVADARARKTDAEIDRLRRVQRAAVAGMACAETVLAASEVGGAETAGATAPEGGSEPDRRLALRWEGAPLTTERLRRAVNATLAARGVRDAGDTAIGVGPSAADRGDAGDDPIPPGETVLVEVSPRGPDGYRGDLARTFVVDGDGGWERRAYLAVESARTVALGEIEPGATAASVRGEAVAELGAYGFDPNAEAGAAGFTRGAGHGVGVSLHEPPSLSSGTELRRGHVIAVEPGVSDPSAGEVRLGDLVAVTDEGYELLAEYPFGIAPAARE
ncbi:M24 family metallopeptidase [Halorubrum amylolyticum]|uniref:M24 family metallopeptidase n=1 Tax=Halorubrum amylolyticum TaxID=2508724 RepID=UPI00100877A0|nr:M24 family metallopeptidase [Halorubrum amylolyticum]